MHCHLIDHTKSTTMQELRVVPGPHTTSVVHLWCLCGEQAVALAAGSLRPARSAQQHVPSHRIICPLWTMQALRSTDVLQCVMLRDIILMLCSVATTNDTAEVVDSVKRLLRFGGVPSFLRP
jgi:hypothetical protein